ncbi:MAG TPA: YfhO family protein, partial [Pyrinomonadaceae bacterium]|nr:YfhO family protein [Pyrinomonadaceae bacterium]
PGEPGISDKMEVIGELHPQETKTLVVRATEADGLRLVTSLSNSTFVPDGETVARVRCFTTDGKIVERELKAGRDTAEWAHERPDVRSLIKHKLATPFDATQIGGEQGYLAYRFQSLLTFGERLRVNRVEITNVSANARLGIYGALLEDSQSKSTFPLSPPFSDAWHPVYEQNGVLVLHNKRALPRAWLVSEAESVNGEEARYRIRGETERSFDPRRTVLLEMHPNELPSLPGGPLAAESEARVVAYEPNRLVVETKSPTATVLVLSEMFYPGWEATVDGQRAKIHLANYLFRAVALPAGQHRVELRYTASAARNGAVISALTLCLIAGLAIYAARRKASGI